MMYEMWKMGRSRLTKLEEELESNDTSKRLHPDSSSLGWYLRHIAEVELLFAKNVFGKDIEVKAQTIGSLAKDRGNFTNLDELLELLRKAEEQLGAAIKEINDWEAEVKTAEFGTVSRAEALARIMTHTAWHAGQIKLTAKYGEE